MAHEHTGHGPDKKNDCPGCEEEYHARKAAEWAERYQPQLPRAIVQITHNAEGGDAWAVLQCCAGDADYYVEMARFATPAEAREFRDWIIAS